MIGYTLKHVLDLVPEALPLVKSANIELDYPTGSGHDAAASALVIEYKQHISRSPVPFEAIEKVATAVQAYRLEGKVQELTGKMLANNEQSLQKQASAWQTFDFMEKQAAWQCSLNGMKTASDIHEEALQLSKEASDREVEPSDAVKFYLGDGYLLKEAALGALSVRFELTNDPIFVKLAAALSKESDVIKPGNMTKSLCSTVTKLDKKAHLDARGLNFFKETLISKQAASGYLDVKICGKSYPLQKVLALPAQYVDQYLGKGFTKELSNDPASAKAMVESLPMDSQKLLENLLKNV